MGRVARKISAGVPQGSVLGPTLWCVLYDDLLRLEMPTDTQLTGYADDLAMTIAADTIEDLNRKFTEVNDRIERWMREHYLELAPGKTKATVMRGPYKRDRIRLVVCGRDVTIEKSVKYLGVSIDTQGYFGKHVEAVIKKAERRVVALAKLMPNIGGPSSGKRQILAGVVHSTLLYAVPIWIKVFRIDKYRKMLEATQRKILLRVGSAYRTVSARAIQVITATIPVDLLAQERSRIWKGQVEGHLQNRQTTIQEWQERWDATTDVAQWTKRLIPQIRPWIDCKHRRVDFHLTQFLSGHGPFRKYTRKIGKATDERCIYCHADEDTPEHTVFVCPRWAQLRLQEWGHMRNPPTAANIVEQMLDTPSGWDRAAIGVKKIMQEKEKEEKAFQQGRELNRPL